MDSFHIVDWLVIGLYGLFTLIVGLVLRKKASQNVDEYFLSGRTLPWWLAGTSMVATSFAADTPLLVSGLVRADGIWKNWLWWCYAVSGVLGIFLFARWWRRAMVMTKAELAELRYGGPAAERLRFVVGGLHAFVTNTWVLGWVMLAAIKIISVLFGIEPGNEWMAVAGACALSVVYSLLAGFRGVVVTDLVQFSIAAAGAVALAMYSWDAVGGLEAIRAAELPANTLRFMPPTGDTGLEASFWTVPVAALAVYLGVSWWAVESVDGSQVSVQRISASRNPRQGVLSTLWFNIIHYSFRPWPWVVVGICSILVLPELPDVESPIAGTVSAVTQQSITIATDDGVQTISTSLDGAPSDWQPRLKVHVGTELAVGDVIAGMDDEAAYVVMMKRYLPVGLLGLVAVSLLAAFMSTIDTHVNLASSFFVNDLYRRFWAPGRSPTHYVWAGRAMSVGVMLLAGAFALNADSIKEMFVLFIAFLGGVGPILLLRWLWWRITAVTEIVAMVTSMLTSISLAWFFGAGWPDSPWTPSGVLSGEGRLVLVVMCSLTAALLSLLLTRRPDPASLVEFYRRVRPLGFWGPVAALCPGVRPDGSFAGATIGIIGGLALIYGAMFGTGELILGDGAGALLAYCIAALGSAGVVYSLRDMTREAAAVDDAQDA